MSFFGVFSLEIERELRVAEQVKRPTVIWRSAKLSDCVAMFLRWIAFVALPVVLRIFFGKFTHIVVAIGLGEYAGSRYLKILSVVLYNG